MACACKYNSVLGRQHPAVAEERSEAKVLMAISLTISRQSDYRGSASCKHDSPSYSSIVSNVAVPKSSSI